MRNIVVIPVYKKQPSEEEMKSLRQGIRILGKHDICLIGPASLDLTVYKQTFDEAGVSFLTAHFDEEFFASQRGYNRLMLNLAFYQQFAEWDYMLIYQLDAYVFSDQLDAWCEKGYDYVGAPFLKLNRTIDPVNSGNGGFSLRYIPAFIRLFSHTGKVLTAKGLWHFNRYRGPLHRLPLTIRGVFGYRNYLSYFLHEPTLNEDLFYSMLGNSALHWRIPSTNEAMYFSFEGGPSSLFARTKQLPFGCHAYMLNEYETFYKPIMNKEGEPNP